MRSLVMALMVALTLCAPLSAMTIDTLDRSPDIVDTVADDIAAIGIDALSLFARPASFDALDWSLAGGTIATTALLTTLDDDARDFARRNQSSSGSDVAGVGNSLGLVLPSLALSGALYVTGLAADAPLVRRAGRHAGQSLLYAGLITGAMKFVIGRARPLLDNSQYEFRALARDDRNQALPSGHATVAFAMASSLSADIDHPAATVTLYGLATLTAVSRVYSDRHWASDVFLGAAIGTACGYAVANMDNAGDDASSMIIVPLPDRLTIVWRLR